MERLPFPQERKKHGCLSSCGSEPRPGALLAFLPAWRPQNSWLAADGHGLLQHPGLRDPSSCRGLPLPGSRRRWRSDGAGDRFNSRQTNDLSLRRASQSRPSVFCVNVLIDLQWSLCTSAGMEGKQEGKHRLGGLGFLQAGHEMKAFDKKRFLLLSIPISTAPRATRWAGASSLQLKGG